MEKNRAQVSVEFIMIIAVLLLILVVIIVMFRARRYHMIALSDTVAARRLADSFSQSMTEIYLAGPGAYKQIYIPAQLNGRVSYTLNISNESHLIVVAWDDFFYTAPLPFASIAFSNVSRGRSLIFNNTGGTIYAQSVS